ncbi:hypothetical protein D0867_01252 [Hortaea werneckii]|uniref:Uncharacterized protein n=2 Tax=Hortaea werneckii TaxID=91943 RepID=A0A3M7AAX5_HORWE|nr:hypothetical protein D0867_01252 [Hortaea werneckii]
MTARNAEVSRFAPPPEAKNRGPGLGIGDWGNSGVIQGLAKGVEVPATLIEAVVQVGGEGVANGRISYLLHLDSSNDSTSRCTVVLIIMYTKAIALAILAVAGVQAQSDYDYEDSDPTPTMASTSYMPAPTGASPSGYMPMPNNGTGPYGSGSGGAGATGSMAGSGMGGGSATATNTPIYTGAASAQKAAGGVAGLGLALIGLL